MKLLLHDFVTRVDNSEVTRLTAADCRCCMGRMDAQIYQNEGWVSWADWLGYGEGKPQRARVSFLPFEQARALVRLQGFSMAAQVSWERFERGASRRCAAAPLVRGLEPRVTCKPS
jgi:hypothetical protein